MRKVRTRRQKVRMYRLGALILLISCSTAGVVVGRTTAPVQTEYVTETVTKTVTVEVPVEVETLPTIENVHIYDVPLSDGLQRYIYEICERENVPVSLVFAMIEHESGFNAEVISKTNDYGLMQINKCNHDELEEQFRCADMLNPYQNVFCGIKIIGSYINKYGDLNKALMAYNMGDYGAEKAWENGIKSTKYSERILKLKENYEVIDYGTSE